MTIEKDQPKTRPHYVDNKKLLEAFIIWKKAIRKAKRLKTEKPPIPEYIGECMLKMANRMATKPGFVNYSFKDEMVSDALESMCRYGHNFNPDKSNNPFSYLSQIIGNSFIRRIQREQKNLYIKMKLIDQSNFLDSYERQDGDNNNYNNNYVTYLQENKGDVIAKFENWKDEKKKRANVKKEAKEKAEADLSLLFEEKLKKKIARAKKKKEAEKIKGKPKSRKTL
jgi:DNA-directed RNA polymerase specialized sigma24 family protein